MTASRADGVETDAGVPHVVLDDDGLDVLELLLTGALARAPELVGAPSGADVVLTDAENTPLARLKLRDAADPELKPLRDLPAGHGPQWDPGVRRRADDVCREVGAAAADAPVLAIVVDEVPTTGDLVAARRAIEATHAAAALWVVPAARRARPAGQVSWAGVTRSALAAATKLATEVPGLAIVRLVIPWPSGTESTRTSASVHWDTAELSLESVLATFGAADTIRLVDLRSSEERESVAALAGAYEREVRALYPAASAKELLAVRRDPRPRGAVVFFTGLSGSGKSTIARALAEDLADVERRVTLLDGDSVRRHLSSELGFDARSREINIDRTAYVASLVAAHGGIAIVALIAPFEASRRAARNLVEPSGAFVLVYVNTPLDVCEARDRKGMYARARSGELRDFTGISSPFEPPANADVVVDTSRTGLPEAVRLVREALERRLAESDSGERSEAAASPV